uniref:Uncharacterized protein n=1 Tax=Romanomermis culicivorax TaxID=13658 RepID=A0A915KUR6_ROMCU
MYHCQKSVTTPKTKEKVKKEKKPNRNMNKEVVNIIMNDPGGLLHIEKMKNMIVERTDKENMHQKNA